MQGIFHDGGWGMYPTTIFGLVLLVCAVNYARDPKRRRLFLLRHLNVLVALSGTLGFVTGVIRTFTNMPSDQLQIAFIGVGESLNNVALALGLMILARIITAFGAAQASESPSELINPP
jgi:hypothetical protein